MASHEFKTNGQIRATEVLLILPDGTKRENVGIQEARTIALDSEMDLVEVAAPKNGGAPVCKILDYNKLRYEQSKRDKHNHSNSSIKEMRVSLHISDFDMERKRGQMFKFLEKRHRVKYTMELKGRQRRQVDEALERFNSELVFFDGKAIIDKTVVSDRNISVVLKPV